MENPECWNNPDQPEQHYFCDWNHGQALASMPDYKDSTVE